MVTFAEQVKDVNGFLKEKHMCAYDLVRIAKTLCCCGTCKYFVQLYTKDFTALDWGHCDKGNIQHSKKVSTTSCGSWDYEEEK